MSAVEKLAELTADARSALEANRQELKASADRCAAAWSAYEAEKQKALSFSPPKAFPPEPSLAHEDALQSQLRGAEYALKAAVVAAEADARLDVEAAAADELGAIYDEALPLLLRVAELRDVLNAELHAVTTSRRADDNRRGRNGGMSHAARTSSGLSLLEFVEATEAKTDLVKLPRMPTRVGGPVDADDPVPPAEPEPEAARVVAGARL